MSTIFISLRKGTSRTMAAPSLCFFSVDEHDESVTESPRYSRMLYRLVYCSCISICDWRKRKTKTTAMSFLLLEVWKRSVDVLSCPSVMTPFALPITTRLTNHLLYSVSPPYTLPGVNGKPLILLSCPAGPWAGSMAFGEMMITM